MENAPKGALPDRFRKNLNIGFRAVQPARFYFSRFLRLIVTVDKVKLLTATFQLLW